MVREPVSWLRNVKQKLWEEVSADSRMCSATAAAAMRMTKVTYRRHFPKFLLLSGLVTCRCRGGGFAIRRHDRYGCFAATTEEHAPTLSVSAVRLQKASIQRSEGCAGISNCGISTVGKWLLGYCRATRQSTSRAQWWQHLEFGYSHA